MVAHNAHQAFHGKVMKRDDSLAPIVADPFDDNKYRFIHMAGKVSDNEQGGNPPNVVTIISQVYVTEPKTFPGPAVYITQTPVTEPLGGVATTTLNSYESAKSVINQPKTRSGNAYLTPTYAGSGYAPTVVKGSPLSHPEYIAQQSHGMSGGQKAGVAIGVLAAIGLVAGLILFCLRRRKKQVEQRGEKLDEKHASQSSFFSGTAAAVGAPAGDKRASFKSFTSTHSASTAPRLSLRPVTQFLPSIMEKRNSAGNNNLSVPAMSEKPRSVSPQNPFSDANERPTNPFDEGDGKGPSTPNHSAKPSWESDGTPKVGTAAAVPVTAAGAAGAAAPRGPSNVHRVQLDFKPSMDDELELKSGQLVRMVHEYDDGWALCMRMDRTQQGVCPRTCLSKVPVKPRPQGAPNGRGSPPGGRGPPPQGPNKMMPRPLTPTGRDRSNTAGGRSASPAPAEVNRTRSQSVTGATEGPVSPIDSGVPARKPVPGQAM